MQHYIRFYVPVAPEFIAPNQPGITLQQHELQLQTWQRLAENRENCVKTEQGRQSIFLWRISSIPFNMPVVEENRMCTTKAEFAAYLTQIQAPQPMHDELLNYFKENFHVTYNQPW